MTTYTYSKATGQLIDMNIQWDRDAKIVRMPSKRKGAKLKLSGSQEMHRKPTHRSGKVIRYRLVNN